mgnify:CR=1 FL=1
MPNEQIKNEILGAGLRLWMIAEKMGLRDDAFSRKLRKEFTPEEKEKIRAIINDLRGGR